MSELAVVDMSDRAFWDDPYPILNAAREQAAVALTPGGQKLVLRHAEVEAALRDPRMRTLGTGLLHNVKVHDGPLYDWWKLVMFNNDPPEHTRLRGLVGRVFTPRRVEAMRPRIHAIARELLEPHLQWGQFDAVSDFAHRLPSQVTCELLGVPSSLHGFVADRTTELGLVFSAVMPPELRARCEAAVVDLRDCVSELLKQRERRPKEDLLSDLIAARAEGDRLSAEEQVAMVINLLFAGNDTTRGLISIGIGLLVAHPEALEALRNQPERVEAAVEEVLRFEAPVLGSLRTPSEPLEIDGVACRPGEPINMTFPAANRDPRRYPDPDRFDITRTDSRPLSFGSGLHHCLGAALARAEAAEALKAVAQLCPGLELAGAPPRFEPFASIRRFAELALRFEPVATAPADS
ncbi:cytochrome P450 [Myxococcota bacterium]|nr:cytochrome P450 [Myxococcota bacterium]